MIHIEDPAISHLFHLPTSLNKQTNKQTNKKFPGNLHVYYYQLVWELESKVYDVINKRISGAIHCCKLYKHSVSSRAVVRVHHHLKLLMFWKDDPTGGGREG